jgi:hypothetical protein
MTDLTSRTLIVTKGVLFLFLAALSGSLLLAASPGLRTVALVAVLAWSSARLYYFLFYVLERYVDPSLRYSGLFALLKAIASSRRAKGPTSMR